MKYSLRLTVLVFSTIFFHSVKTQALIINFSVFAYCMIVYIYKPYRMKVFNKVEIIIHALIFISIYCALMCFNDNVTQTQLVVSQITIYLTNIGLMLYFALIIGIGYMQDLRRLGLRIQIFFGSFRRTRELFFSDRKKQQILWWRAIAHVLAKVKQKNALADKRNYLLNPLNSVKDQQRLNFFFKDYQSGKCAVQSPIHRCPLPFSAVILPFFRRFCLPRSLQLERARGQAPVI